jgi:DNA polymerase-3 subunit delta
MMTPEQALSRLQARDALPSFIFCFGEEPQRLLDTIDALALAGCHKGFIERQLMVVESVADWGDVLNAYQELSLFSSQRVMLVQVNTKMSAAQSDQLQSLVLSPNPDVLLLLRAGALDKSAQEAKWVRAWDSVGWVINSKALPLAGVQRWLQEQASALGMRLQPDAADALAHWSEGNLMSAKQSLLRWQLQGLTTLDMALLERDSQDWARYDVFALSAAILAQNPRDALRILARLQEEGEDAVLILWAVSRELRSWAALIDDVKQKRAWSSQTLAIHKLWGGRDKILWRLLERVQPTMIKNWLAACLTIDREVKGQATGDAWRSLRWLVADMASAGNILPIKK